jgi:hypothetical protein
MADRARIGNLPQGANRVLVWIPRGAATPQVLERDPLDPSQFLLDTRSLATGTLDYTVEAYRGDTLLERTVGRVSVNADHSGLQVSREVVFSNVNPLSGAVTEMIGEVVGADGAARPGVVSVEGTRTRTYLPEWQPDAYHYAPERIQTTFSASRISVNLKAMGLGAAARSGRPVRVQLVDRDNAVLRTVMADSNGIASLDVAGLSLVNAGARMRVSQLGADGVERAGDRAAGGRHRRRRLRAAGAGAGRRRAAGRIPA